MRRLTILFVVLLLLGSATSAEASVFINPPEDFPGVSWNVPDPYQRNVLLDFNSDHTYNDPSAADDGIYGAGYYGTLDPTLKDSDWVAYSNIDVGDAGVFLPGYTSPSDTPVAKQEIPPTPGTITIHLDNTETLGLKEMWIEFVTTSDDGAFGYEPIVTLGGGSTDGVTYLGRWYEPYDGHPGWYVTNMWVQITPNPFWETITFSVPFSASSTPYLIDSIQIATNCIPEPSTLLIWSLLGAAGMGLGVWRRRRGGQFMPGDGARAAWSEENRQAIHRIIARGGRC